MEMQYKDASFITVLEEPVSSTLLFPDEFVQKYGEMLPQEALLMTTDQKYGRCWRVKVARLYSGRFCFGQGWPHFVGDNPEIRASDYAVFRLVDASTFHVSVFGNNGLKKPLTRLIPFPPPPPPHQDVEKNDESPVVQGQSSKSRGGVKEVNVSGPPGEGFITPTFPNKSSTGRPRKDF